MTLFRQYFRIQRSGLVLWAGTNGFLGWALGASAKGMVTTNALSNFMTKAIDKLPSAIRALMGLAPGVSPIDNLIQAKMGFWMAIALPIYGCLMAVAAVSREIDRGTADFLLSLPVERRRVLISRWAVMGVNLAAVTVATWGGLSAGLAMGGVAASFRGYFWMIAQAALVGLATGTIALLASMWADYERAMKRALAGVGILFSLDIVMDLTSMPKIAGVLNPYTYFDTLEPLLRNGPVLEDASVLMAISLISLWLAVRVFQSRQIEA